MQVSGLADEIKILSANAASTEDLLRVHPTGYLKEFEELSTAGGGELGVTAPFGPGSFDIAKVSAGLAIQAVESVVSGTFKNAYSMSRPPGHHCLAEKPMGFCLLANIALAIEAAKAKHGLERIAVVDWDVHHGNGTQSIFFERSDVLTISMHQEGCFPPGYSGGDDIGEGQGEGYNINVPLLPGGGHEAYKYAMERVVMPALDRYKPELIIVASGYDADTGLNFRGVMRSSYDASGVLVASEEYGEWGGDREYYKVDPIATADGGFAWALGGSDDSTDEYLVEVMSWAPGGGMTSFQVDDSDGIYARIAQLDDGRFALLVERNVGDDGVDGIDLLIAQADGTLDTEVRLQNVQPPQQVIDAFDEVQRAQQDLDRRRNEADAYRNKVIPEARGEAQRAIQEAAAYKEQIINEAQGEAQRFLSVYTAYKQNPEVTERRMYLETIQEVFSKTDKVIMDSQNQGAVPYLPLNELRQRSRQDGSPSSSGNN